jgi:hypothetical protein
MQGGRRHLPAVDLLQVVVEGQLVDVRASPERAEGNEQHHDQQEHVRDGTPDELLHAGPRLQAASYN